MDINNPNIKHMTFDKTLIFSIAASDEDILMKSIPDTYDYLLTSQKIMALKGKSSRSR